MERQGFTIDLPALAVSEGLAAQHLVASLTSLHAQAPGLNPNSPDQVNAWLRGKGVDPSPVTKKGPAFNGAESTDGAALEYMADHNPGVASVLRGIIQHRKISSGLKYTRKLRHHSWLHPDGASRVHCSLTRAAATGRLAAARPELQQIPKDQRKDLYGIRSGFIASPGYELVIVDQAQLEMRILAHYLLDLFQDESLAADLASTDCHSANSLRVFGPHRGYLAGVTPDEVKSHPDARVRQVRDDIKAVIYGMNYGKGDWALGGTLRDEHGEPVGRAVARSVMDGIFGLYPSLERYHEWVRHELLRYGGIGTLLGRFRPLAGARSRDRKTAARAWRQGINTPMQGGGADIMDLVLLLLSQNKGLAKLGYRMLVPVHDEVVGEAPIGRGEEVGMLVKADFESAYQMRVPLVASVGVSQTWAGGH